MEKLTVKDLYKDYSKFEGKEIKIILYMPTKSKIRMKTKNLKYLQSLYYQH